MECTVCQRRCNLDNGQIGYCGGWQNQEEQLINIAYGRITLAQRQLVTRIPLSFWRQREEVIGIGAYGCPLRCTYCFNSRYAHTRPTPELLETITKRNPEWLVLLAEQNNCAITTDFVGMPNIFAFVKDTFKLARERNVPTILSTEGLLTEESFRDILPFCDVVRIDIKGGSIQSLTDNNIWNSEFFLKRPYQVAKMGKEFGCFVEFTIPVVPTLNNSVDDLQKIAQQVLSLCDMPITLIGHKKSSNKIPWASATVEDVLLAQDVLTHSGLTQVKILEV